MEYTKEEQEIIDNAVAYVKENKDAIVESVIGNVMPVKEPVSIFMAGSPGAGKTEFSKHFLSATGFENDIVRIDPDAIRALIPTYTGGNAHLFQRAISRAVDYILNYVFKNNIHFLLDGTFSSEVNAKRNIKRAIKHNRYVQINFVYQPKEVAWHFTQERELVEGRRITREIFDKTFKNSVIVVQSIKDTYGDDVRVDFIERNVETGEYEYRIDIRKIDKYVNLM